MTTRRVLRYDGTTIGVGTSNAGDLDWLAEFLRPHFRVLKSGPTQHSVDFRSDPPRWEALRRSGSHPRGKRVDCFLLEGKTLRYPVWQSDGDSTVTFDEQLGVFYIVDPSRRSVSILKKDHEPLRRLALMRVVREIAMNHCSRDDTMLVHACAFLVGRHGILVAGGKGAGKTSLLIHAMRQGKARYISNDRVVIRSVGQELIVHGVPTIVNLPSSTVEQFPDLHRELQVTSFHPAVTKREADLPAFRGGARYRGGFTLSPAQFCEMLGRTPRGRAPLTALLFPSVVQSAKGIELERLPASRAVKRLTRSVFRARFSRKTGGLFCFDGRALSPPGSQLERLAQDVAAKVVCYLCRLGPAAYTGGSFAADLRRQLRPSAGSTDRPAGVRDSEHF